MAKKKAAEPVILFGRRRSLDDPHNWYLDLSYVSGIEDDGTVNYEELTSLHKSALDAYGLKLPKTTGGFHFYFKVTEIPVKRLDSITNKKPILFAEADDDGSGGCSISVVKKWQGREEIDSYCSSIEEAGIRFRDDTYFQIEMVRVAKPKPKTKKDNG